MKAARYKDAATHVASVSELAALIELSTHHEVQHICFSSYEHVLALPINIQILKDWTKDVAQPN